jgi:hypothetical protein
MAAEVRGLKTGTFYGHAMPLGILVVYSTENPCNPCKW